MKILLASVVTLAALLPMSAPASATPSAECRTSGPAAGHRFVRDFSSLPECCRFGGANGYSSFFCQKQGRGLFDILDDPFDPYETYLLYAKR
jgi:hypothetical protein